MIELSSRVRRHISTDDRIGTVVNMNDPTGKGRVQVLWDGNPKARLYGDRPKRIWIKYDSLIEV